MNSINYGIPEESTNVETLPAKESYTAEVPGKKKEDEVISGLREGINCQHPSEESNQTCPLGFQHKQNVFYHLGHVKAG